MKTHKEIQHKVEEAFQAVDAIEKVEVSPFFKHKILQKIDQDTEERPLAARWFTPQLQFAAIIVILLMNVAAILYSFSSTKSADIEAFAQEYNLDSDSSSLLN